MHVKDTYLVIFHFSKRLGTHTALLTVALVTRIYTQHQAALPPIF
jgi:hypothetical protein